jgi:hypothetical protein
MQKKTLLKHSWTPAPSTIRHSEPPQKIASETIISQSETCDVISGFADALRPAHDPPHREKKKAG